MRTCPQEYGEPAWVNAEENEIVSYTVTTGVTGLFSRKQERMIIAKDLAWEDAIQEAKEYALEKDTCADVWAVYSNGKAMCAAEYMGDAGELITEGEEKEPEYDDETAKEIE
jgi:hypothetical protein